MFDTIPLVVHVNCRLPTEVHPPGSPDHTNVYPPDPVVTFVKKFTIPPLSRDPLALFDTGVTTTGSAYTVYESVELITWYPLLSATVTPTLYVVFDVIPLVVHVNCRLSALVHPPGNPVQVNV